MKKIIFAVLFLVFFGGLSLIPSILDGDGTAFALVFIIGVFAIYGAVLDFLKEKKTQKDGFKIRGAKRK